MPEEPQVYRFKRRVGLVDTSDIVFLQHMTYDDERRVWDFTFELADAGAYVTVTSLNGATPQGVETMMGNYGFLPLYPKDEPKRRQ